MVDLLIFSVYTEAMKQAKQIIKKNLRFPTIFQHEPEGGFTVTVPALPGCITFGKTIEEAEKMAEEAIRLYLEDMLDSGEPLPQTSDMYVGNVEVALPRRKHKTLVHA